MGLRHTCSSWSKALSESICSFVNSKSNTWVFAMILSLVSDLGSGINLSHKSGSRMYAEVRKTYPRCKDHRMRTWAQLLPVS